MKSPKKRFRETFGRSSLYFEYFEYFEIQKIQKIQNIFVLAKFFEYFEIQKIQNIQNIQNIYLNNNEITKKEVQRDFWEKFIIF